ISFGPHQMNIGWLVFSRMRNAVRKLCGQVSGVPSGLADQSYARVNAPISPPPARKSPEVGRSIFSIQDDRWRVQPNWQPDLTACHNPSKPAGRRLVPNIFLSGRNKIAAALASAALTIGPRRHDLATPRNAAGPLLHQARSRERARDDGTDVNPPTPRLMRRLRTATRLGTTIKRRQRPEHRGEIRHLRGCRSSHYRRDFLWSFGWNHLL